MTISLRSSCSLPFASHCRFLPFPTVSFRIHDSSFTSNPGHPVGSNIIPSRRSKPSTSTQNICNFRLPVTQPSRSDINRPLRSDQTCLLQSPFRLPPRRPSTTTIAAVRPPRPRLARRRLPPAAAPRLPRTTPGPPCPRVLPKRRRWFTPVGPAF